MRTRLKFAASLAALSFALSLPVQAATLIGDVMQTIWSFPPVGTPDSTVSASPNPFTVGAGVETIFDVENGTAFVAADFDASALLMTFTTPLGSAVWLTSTQNGPVFTVVSGNPFPGVVSATTSNGGAIAAYLLNGDLYVNLSGWTFSSGDTATVLFDADATPLPAAFPLFGSILGAAALIGWARKRRTMDVGSLALPQ